MKKRGNWTSEEEEYIVECFHQGLRAPIMAENLNRGLRAVGIRLNQLGCRLADREKKIIPCLQCGKDVEIRPFQTKKLPKFCSQSCGATYNNLQKGPSHIQCQACGIQTTYRKGKKYCSIKCQNRNKSSTIVQDWLAGNYNATTGIKAWSITLSKPIRNYLISQVGNKCSRCGWAEVNQSTGNVPLQVDHIDGNCRNNVPDNLRILCPNCHSLTSNYGMLNKGNSQRGRKYED